MHVLTGAPLATMLDDVAAAISVRRQAGARNTPSIPRISGSLFELRRFKNGEDLYASLGIAREDKPRRMLQFVANYHLFGAPVGLFFCLDRRVGPPQWSDMGMFMQTVMLLAVEEGLDTCAQEAWSRFPRTVRQPSRIAGARNVVLGHGARAIRDEAHPINQWRSDRASLDEVAAFKGF